MRRHDSSDSVVGREAMRMQRKKVAPMTLLTTQHDDWTGVHAFPPRVRGDMGAGVLAVPTLHLRPKVTGFPDMLFALEQRYPEWFAELDVNDPCTCTRPALMELIETAPAPFLQGMLYGQLMMRIQLAAITGRSFRTDETDETNSSPVLAIIADTMATLEAAHPHWFFELDTTDTCSCSREQLMQLITMAPKPFLQGMLYGQLALRIQMAAITGRPFR
jgi:hypothetical protein